MGPYCFIRFGTVSDFKGPNCLRPLETLDAVGEVDVVECTTDVVRLI
jgi:hypothetical protein